MYSQRTTLYIKLKIACLKFPGKTTEFFSLTVCSNFENKMVAVSENKDCFILNGNCFATLAIVG